MTTKNPEDQSSNGGESPAEGEGASTPRRRRKKRRGQAAQAGMSLNSLMDIVVIILVYLIKSFATSPIDIQDPATEIPASTSHETIEDGAVVMLSGPVRKLYDPESGTTSYAENAPTLSVDGRRLFELQKVAGETSNGVSYRVPAAQKAGQAEGSFVIEALKAELIKAKENQEILASEMGSPEFTGRVVILADKRTPYRVLMDVLVTCGQVGFGEFRFAILKGSS